MEGQVCLHHSRDNQNRKMGKRDRKKNSVFTVFCLMGHGFLWNGGLVPSLFFFFFAFLLIIGINQQNAFLQKVIIYKLIKLIMGGLQNMADRAG